MTQTQTPRSAWLFYKYMALIVGTALALLTFVALPYEYWPLHNGKNSFTSFAWTAHGWTFMVYLIATFNLSIKRNWGIGRMLLIMVAGTVPLMSFVTERKLAKEIEPELATATT